ncbi:MAG TPA: DsbA family protein [Candidatus Binataceae bacterium]|nr:DsbA family protein [Candidatus Binataceae bacterium]
MIGVAEIKFYYDYKSPFSYLAFDPALELERSHRVSVRFVPFRVDLGASKGGNPAQRDDHDWRKVRYLYMDARRFAADRGIVIRDPQKLFDSSLALIGGIFAERHGCFREYSRQVFERFFRRELDLEDIAALGALFAELGLDAAGFRSFADTEGSGVLELAEAEADRDRVFGAPTLIVASEIFWGNDRMQWAIRKLDAMGLRRAGDTQRAQ